jgi:hypothetical protein
MRCHGTNNLARYIPDTNQYTMTFSIKITATLQWTKTVLHLMYVIYTRLKITATIRGVYKLNQQHYITTLWSRVSSVCIATRLRSGGPRNRGSIRGRGSALRAHPASYPASTGADFSEVKRQGRNADHSHLVQSLRKVELYLHPPILHDEVLHWALGLQLFTNLLFST